MTLRLHAAAHDAERFPRFAIFHDEPGNDRVKWTFPRRVNVRMLRIHREKFATVLKHEARSAHAIFFPSINVCSVPGEFLPIARRSNPSRMFNIWGVAMP